MLTYGNDKICRLSSYISKLITIQVPNLYINIIYWYLVCLVLTCKWVVVKKILYQNYVLMEGVPATVGMHWAKELLFWSLMEDDYAWFFKIYMCIQTCKWVVVKKILYQNYVLMEGVPATVGMHWAKELLFWSLTENDYAWFFMPGSVSRPMEWTLIQNCMPS